MELDAGTTDDNKIHTCFLDSFPKELMNNILRFFSRIPKAKDWESLTPLSSIIELYGVTGQLGKFMKPRFNSLCVSKSFDCQYETTLYRWEKRKCGMLWTNDFDVARRFVLAGGGNFLHTIIVGSGIYHEDMGTDIVDEFLENCPNVKSLSIEDKKGVWVSRFGGQLEQLEIVTETPSAISKTSRNLRVLNMFLFGGTTTHQTDLWEYIGKRLEYLTLCCIFNNQEEIEIEKIMTYCRNLRQIRINHLWKRNKEISNLLTSYGDQLEYCHAESMNEGELTSITSACKNVRFSATLLASNGMDTLNILGSRLEVLNVTYRSFWLDYLFCGESIYFGEWFVSNPWNKCVNIRTLKIDNCSIQHARTIMATPKVHLKILNISIADRMQENEVKTMLDIFSKGTGGVEKLVYYGESFFGGAMDKFIARNQTTLREFHLSIGMVSAQKLDTLLPRFLKCPSLDVVTISGDFALANTPTMHRINILQQRRSCQNILETLENRGVRCHGLVGNPSYE